MEQNTNKSREDSGVEFVSWDEFKTYLLIDRKQSDSTSSVSALKSRYKKLSAYFSTQPFNRATFNAFISKLHEQQYSPSYVNNFIKMGKLIGLYYKIDAVADYSYFREKHQVFIDTLKPDEIVSLAETVIPYYRDALTVNFRMKCLIYLLGRTGCRIGEALSLLWDDVHQTHVLFRDTKNGDDRAVPIKPSMYQLLQGLPRVKPFVFCVGTTNEVNLDLKRRAKKVGITKNVYCHLFRHSYISEMTKQKVPVTYIARIVGHKNLETTNRYTHALLHEISQVMSYHPLEKTGQDFEELKKRIEEYLEQIVDKKAVRYRVNSSSNELVVTLCRE